MNDGGQAFPVQVYEGNWNPGMTLRDYFAIQVLTSLVSRSGTTYLEYHVKTAYTTADLMLKEREQNALAPTK